MPRADVADCARQILSDLPNIMCFVRQNMRKSRAKALSVPQFRALYRVQRKGTLTDVALWLGITLPSASRLVSGLVTKGYLQRVECSEDRRVRNLSLTARGQRVLNDAFDATQRAMEAELCKLTDAECRTVAKSVRRMAELFVDGRAV